MPRETAGPANGFVFIEAPLPRGERVGLSRVADAEAAGEARFEVEDVIKILAAVFLGLLHLLDADQVEDDLAEVARIVDTPTVEHGLGHVAILLQGIDP